MLWFALNPVFTKKRHHACNLFFGGIIVRFGSHNVPMRVMVSLVCLSGLGAAATFPSIMPSIADERTDPMITDSISKVDVGEPTQTTLPSQTDMQADMQTAAPSAPESSVPSAAPIRQVLPGAPSLQQAAPQVIPQMAPQQAAQPMMAAPTAGDEIVQPVMTDFAGLSQQPPSAGGTIVLALDHARVLRMVGQVATIIVGNPAIADVAMPDPSTMVLTGKSYGETNMVMLDAAGNILAEQMLRVTVRGQDMVSVYRGVQRTTLSCSPTCEIRPTPGDTPDMLASGMSAFEARNAAALAAVRSQ